MNTSDASKSSESADRPASGGGRNPLVLVVVLLLIVFALLVLMRPKPPAPESAAVREVIAKMNEGIGKLEQYDYGAAHDIFVELTEAHPDWAAAWVNRGIAALNLQEEEKCIPAFEKALELDPKNRYALLSLGIQHQHLDQSDRALELFQKVAELDPEDPHAQYYLGSIFAERNDREAANKFFRRALQLQPSFGSAWYQLANLHRTKETRAERARLLAEFQRLRNNAAAVLVGVKYGEGGQYNLAMRGTHPPSMASAGASADPVPGRPALRVTGEAWTGDLVLERKLASTGAYETSFAVGDVTGDGNLDILAAGAKRVGNGPPPRLVRYSLKNGSTTGEYAIAHDFDRDTTLVALGDLDGDADLDLVTATRENLTAFANDGKGNFSPVDLGNAVRSQAGVPLRLCLVDLDSDWDLDIAVLRHLPGEGEAPPTRSTVQLLKNHRDEVREGVLGRFTDVAAEIGVAELDFVATELAVSDWDGDVDLDLLLLDGATGRPHIYSNHRAWKFVPSTTVEGLSVGRNDRQRNHTVGWDADGDGDEDLVVFGGSSIELLENRGGLRFAPYEGFAQRFGNLGGTSGCVFDLAGTGTLSLVIFDASVEGDAKKSRTIAIPNVEKTDFFELRTGDAGPLVGSIEYLGEKAGVQMILGGANQPLRGYRLEVDEAYNWIALDLRGPKLADVKPESERSNPAAIGATVEVRSGQRSVTQRLNAGTGGSVRQSTRLFVLLGEDTSPDFVRILWPDGILQSELGLTAARLHTIREKERKPSSCPVVFAWNGEEFEFVGDFLGVGGLGYFEAPGKYNTPDPSEVLAIPRLEPRTNESGESVYELRVLEPLEECTYLDSASLLVVDHPAETTVLPFEMFAIAGPAPPYGLAAFEKSCRPVRAVDQSGRVVTDAVLNLDRQYAPDLENDPRFRGVLRRLHSIEIDFSDELDAIVAEKSGGARPVLFLWGYIEYGYSTTNFAASQTEFTPKVPSFFVERAGRWEPLRLDWGFPGGYPRWMALDLDGLLRAGDRRIRIETNLEIAWDQIFLAAARDVPLAAEAEKNDRSVGAIRLRDLRADVADLQYRGFPVDPPPGDEFEGFVYREFQHWEHYRAMPGNYTKFGDVRELLEGDDNRFAILGPGDEISLSFRADRVDQLEGGRRRSFFLKSGGFCKDMDLYTGHGDGVEPLPFHGMTSYPMPAGESSPETEDLRAYRAEWNTRVIEADVRTPIRDVVPPEEGS